MRQYSLCAVIVDKLDKFYTCKFYLYDDMEVILTQSM